MNDRAHMHLMPHLIILCSLALLQTRLQAGAAQGLQERIDLAHAGDSIHVQSGTFFENIRIIKPIHLIGEGQPRIHGTGHNSVVTIVADSCTLRGFTIEHSGPMLSDEDAGILVQSNHNTIEQNILRDVLFGIYLYHAEFNVINNNVITGRKELDVGQRGSGIHIWNSNNNTIVGNSITDARDGFYIQYANHTRIERNQAFALRYGVHYMWADSNFFLDNRFFDNVAGAAIMYSKSILIRRNTFVRNRGFTSFGLLFQDCHDTQVDSNIIADNVTGLFLESSTGNQFRHNIIAQNDVALQFFQNSTGNTFSENNFLDNLNPLVLIGKQTDSHWDDGSRGNYWSDYEGYDLDANGIGDVPMKIQNVFQYLEGRNENLRLYLYSPAAQALAAGTKAFPIMEINRETDDNPLMRPLRVDLVSSGMRLDTTPSVQENLTIPVAGLAAVGLFVIIIIRRVTI